MKKIQQMNDPKRDTILPISKQHTNSTNAQNSSGIFIDRLSKSYGDELVLNNLTLHLESNRIYCLMAPSGTGKTTLFRILMGLEKADFGQIHGLDQKRIAAVFQENRLLEGYTALENLRFVTGRLYTAEELTDVLTQLLPEESLSKPVCEFSGGMKRRTAILRAILAPSDFIIMDEPFTGLDAETKQRAIDLILTYTKGKLLLLSTHNEEDATLLAAEIIRLNATIKNSH